MNYKNRLNELVQQEVEARQAEEHRRSSFEGQQRASFAKLTGPLLEILETAMAVIPNPRVYETSAELTIVSPRGREVVYRIEPNSLGKYSSSPSAKPGYEVETETNLKNINERSTKVEVFASVEEVLENFMKLVAEALADRQQEKG
jgi:hypothetical protein